MSTTTRADQIQQAVYEALNAQKTALNLVTVADQQTQPFDETEIDAIDVRLAKTLQNGETMDAMGWIAEIELHIYSKSKQCGVIHHAAHPIVMDIAQPSADFAYDCEHIGIDQDTTQTGNVAATLRIAAYRFKFYEPYGQI
jgi:hypothetical protein